MLLDLDPEDPQQQLAILALSDAELPAHDNLVFNAAPDDQQLSGLRGDERVRIEGVKADGPVDFRLPGDRPLAVLHRGKGPEPVILRLDTIWIDADKEEVRLTWRGRLAVSSTDEVDEYPELRVEIKDGDDAAALSAAAAGKEHEGDTLVLEGDEVGKLEDEEAQKGSAAALDDDAEDVYVEGVEYEVSPFGPDLSDGPVDEVDPEQLLEQQRAERRKKVQELKAKALAAKEAAEKKKKGKKKS